MFYMRRTERILNGESNAVARPGSALLSRTASGHVFAEMEGGGPMPMR